MRKLFLRIVRITALSKVVQIDSIVQIKPVSHLPVCFLRPYLQLNYSVNVPGGVKLTE